MSNRYPGLAQAPTSVPVPEHTTKPEMSLNSSLNFEQRVLRPSAYPALPMGRGELATHLMGWGNMGERAVAFPTIIQTPRGNLVNLGKDAFRYAVQTGDFRSFGSDAEAANYAEGGYKHYWGAGDAEDLKKFGRKK